MGFKRLAATILVITFILGISSGSAFASEKTDVGAAVYRHFDNLDNDKLETALAMCDSQVSILEEFPPHEWHGPTACADGWKALGAYSEKSGISDGDATLGPPWTVDVSGDCAYFVAPAKHSTNGRPVLIPQRGVVASSQSSTLLCSGAGGKLRAAKGSYFTR